MECKVKLLDQGQLPHGEYTVVIDHVDISEEVIVWIRLTDESLEKIKETQNGKYI